MDEYSKIFEEKTAQSNQGDGSPEMGPAWMRWTRLYLIGNAPDAEVMLNAAEMAQRPITMQDVASLGGTTRMNVDPVVLSGHIWRYLNQATCKSARSIFENLEVRNGMEAWRRLYRHIHKGSLLQKHTLGLKIQSPATYLKEAGNLAIGIDKWEQDIRDYVAAGGQYPAEDSMVMNLCSALPSTLRSNLIWRTNEFQSYMHFKHYVVEQVERLEHFNGKNAIMFMGEEDEDELYALAQERLRDYPDLAEALVFGKGRPAQRPGGVRPTKQGAPGPGAKLPGPKRDAAAARPEKCINCGGPHRSSACTKPRVEKHKRPCWTCGKPGCTAATCKSKKQLSNLEHEDNEGDEETFCLGEWKTVASTRHGPMQSSNTMGDYIDMAKRSSPARDLCNCRGSGAGSFLPTDELTQAKPSVTERAIPVKNRFEGLLQEGEVAYMKTNEDDMDYNENRDTDFNSNEPQITDYVDTLIDEDKNLIDGFVQNFDIIHACGRCQDGRHDGSGKDGDVSLCEYEEDMLLPVEDDEVILEITADTGAVDNVTNPKELPGFHISESYGSRNGKHFLGAGAERIRNEGEVKLSMEPVDGGQRLGSTFQAADITRTLMSISKVCDSAPETKVTFDSHKGVVTRRGRSIATFQRKGGLYVMKVKVKKPKTDTQSQPMGKDGAIGSRPRDDGPAAGFPRQGLKR